MTSDVSELFKAYDIRGLAPELLGPKVARAIGSAFAEVIALPDSADSVVLGRDMRPSSPALLSAFAAGVQEYGLDVIDVGLVSTDALYYASGILNMPGVMFTASHNPAHYNGMKLCRSGARPIGEDNGLMQIRDLTHLILTGDAKPSSAPKALGEITTRNILAEYAAFLTNLVDLSDARPLRICVDAGNGMAGLTVPAVFGTTDTSDSPFTIDALYFQLDGSFPNHEANPLDPKNLVDLQRRVRDTNADMGIAFDGDADRCFFVDERGEAVTPSALTALIATREIAREIAREARPEDISIVYNAITSLVVPEVVSDLGARSIRTRVGHSFIKGVMHEHQAVFGGEHSAHYYFRDFWYADSGMLAAMHILAALSESNVPLSQVVAPFERYFASGEINFEVSDALAITQAVRDTYSGIDGVSIRDDDGVTVSREASLTEPMWWFNIRSSNTEPLLRLNVEGADRAAMIDIRDTVSSQIRNLS